MTTARRIALTSLVAFVAAVLPAGAAQGAILPQSEIDAGPDVVAFGDVAISDDGTGGLVYERVGSDGRTHIYASLLRGGAWSPPMRVDVGQEFRSMSPRIGAGRGGRLVVIWIQDGGFSGERKTDRLFSASLDPGASSFEAPMPIDLDVGDGRLVHPDVEMAPGGQAFLLYRTVSQIGIAGGDLPIGYALGMLRLARFESGRWSRLDQALNRNIAAPFRAPTADTAPRLALDQAGNAVVAFQEPDDQFIDRVWVRRVFGGTFGLPILMSPNTWNGAPLRGSADQIRLAVGPSGNVAVTFRQAAGIPPVLDSDRVMINTLPNVFSTTPIQPTGVRSIDGGSGGPVANAGVAVNSALRFAANFVHGDSRIASGTDEEVADSGDAVPTDASTRADGIEIAESGRTVTARAAGEVVVDEAGSTLTARRGFGPAGSITGLKLAGSRFGDAAIGWLQGTDQQRRLVGAVVDAPPETVAIEDSEGWLRTRRPRVVWQPAADSFGGVGYSVKIRGREIVSTGVTAVRLPRMRDGRHAVEVTSFDRLGQSGAPQTTTLRLDRRAPKVRVRRLSGGRVRIRIVDGRRGRVSGVSRRSTIRVQGQRRIRGRSAVTVKAASRARVVVVARDRAGNVRRVVRRLPR